MAVALPLDVYEVLESRFGKEDATKVVKSFEIAISDITEYKWKTSKDELLDAIRNEFITKDVFIAEMKAIEEKINSLRVEMRSIKTELEGRIENVKTELEGRIENLRVELEGKIGGVRTGLEGRIDGLNGKINFLIILTILALTLMNPVVAEIIKNLLK